MKDGQIKNINYINQNLNNNNNNNIFELLSIIMGISGFISIFFSFIAADILFITGIILGIIHIKKNKKKKLGLILNIIGLSITIIFFIMNVLIIKNTMNDVAKKSECMANGGYFINGKCVNYDNYDY